MSFESITKPFQYTELPTTPHHTVLSESRIKISIEVDNQQVLGLLSLTSWIEGFQSGSGVTNIPGWLELDDLYRNICTAIVHAKTNEVKTEDICVGTSSTGEMLSVSGNTESLAAVEQIMIEAHDARSSKIQLGRLQQQFIEQEMENNFLRIKVGELGGTVENLASNPKLNETQAT